MQSKNNGRNGFGSSSHITYSVIICILFVAVSLLGHQHITALLSALAGQDIDSSIVPTVLSFGVFGFTLITLSVACGWGLHVLMNSAPTIMIVRNEAEVEMESAKTE